MSVFMQVGEIALDATSPGLPKSAEWQVVPCGQAEIVVFLAKPEVLSVDQHVAALSRIFNRVVLDQQAAA